MQQLDASYHLIGIGGVGMSGLARLLLERGASVSGSDLRKSEALEALRERGARVYQGHAPSQLPKGAHIVYSSGIPEDNVELEEARRLDLPLLHRSELLDLLMRGKKPLLVAGSHGKTTTSSLLASALFEGGLDPSYAIGGTLSERGTNSALGLGEWFVAEADESDGSFLNYSCHAAILTNIGKEHLAHYQTEDKLLAAFAAFAGRAEGKLLFCGDDARLKALNLKGISYGFSPCDWTLRNYRQLGEASLFDLEHRGVCYPGIRLSLMGRHNALNAAAVFALGRELGIDEGPLRRALSGFQGVSRRLEKIGEAGALSIWDDYAHHPTEIASTLEALREAVRERELIALFQPHRYSRTSLLFKEFSKAFAQADRVVVTDVYAAGESPLKGVTGEALAATLPQGLYLPREELGSKLRALLRPHSVLITLGAGDISKVSKELLASLKERPLPPLKIGLIGGGRSPEHEISLRSLEHLSSGLSADYHEIKPFFISKKGGWSLEKSPLSEEPLQKELFESLMECDLLFPMLHGPYGEDGTVQGFFETLGKPYTGCGVLASALAMDKALCKKIASQCGLKTAPYLEISKASWKRRREELLRKAAEELPFPLFVKPARLGSSIGVERVEEKEALEGALSRALLLDSKILVEQQVVGRELEFALLGNAWVEVFSPGEILAGGEPYDLDKKLNCPEIASPSAELSDSCIEEGKRQALEMYLALGCQGMARIDFFLDDRMQFWFNEVNPTPGFTALSLYPKLCSLAGYSMQQLFDRLTVLALHRFRCGSSA